jgi:hypothetical protein
MGIRKSQGKHKRTGRTAAIAAARRERTLTKARKQKRRA